MAAIRGSTVDCFCCREVIALNEKFNKLAVKCKIEVEEFQTLCINKAVLDNVLFIGLHASRVDYLEKITYKQTVHLVSL